MKKFLVATDGSENSKDAIIEARNLAKLTDGSLTILIVVEPISKRAYPSVKYQGLQDDKSPQSVGQSILDSYSKLVEDLGNDLTSKVRTGDPAEEIIKEAEEGDYDLIVMGNRGLGGFTRAMLGSVSNKVLNHTKKNVLIVR